MILDGFGHGKLAEVESKIKSGAMKSVSGVNGFALEGAVYSDMQVEVGNPHYEKGLLPRTGIAVSITPKEKSTDDGDVWEVTLPKVSQFRFPGSSARPSSYSVLFVNAKTDESFAYPSMPSTSSGLNITKIVPHSMCPTELHDIWTATPRDTEDPDNYENGDIKGSLMKHATWHPLIDPVYWCSYGHDHGSFPGKLNPAFTATAWKTKDVTTHNSRQDESQEGFKVFSMHENGLRFIFTVHMELNNPRRFHTRHHTVHVNVFTSEWKLQAELTLKNDFGFAATRVKGKGVLPLNEREAEIRAEMIECGRRAFRQVNVRRRSASCHFDGAIDTTPKNGDFGSAEHWEGPLNTCSNKKGGFKVDVTRPATGLMTCDNGKDALEVDVLSGPSIQRAFTSLRNGLELSRANCLWSKSLPTEVGADGLVKFYTDSYLAEVVPGRAKYHIAQWMAPDFKAVLPKGRYNPVDHWHGQFKRKGKGVPKVRGSGNVGGWAVLPMEN